VGSGRSGQTLKRLRGRPGPPALQPGYDGLGCIHALRELLLSKTRGDARMDDRPGKRKLWCEIFVSLAVLLVLHPLPMEVVHFGHGKISFARLSANSISWFGVFRAFLKNTRSTTTHRFDGRGPISMLSPRIPNRLGRTTSAKLRV